MPELKNHKWINLIFLSAISLCLLASSCKKEVEPSQEPLVICEGASVLVKKYIRKYENNVIVRQDTIIYCFDENDNLLGVDKYRDPNFENRLDYNYLYEYDSTGVVLNAKGLSVPWNIFRFTHHFIKDENNRVERIDIETSKPVLLGQKRIDYQDDGKISMLTLYHPEYHNNFYTYDTIKYFWQGDLLDSIYYKAGPVGAYPYEEVKFYYSDIPNQWKDKILFQELGASGGNAYCDFLVDSMLVYRRWTNELFTRRFEYELDVLGRVTQMRESTEGFELIFSYE